ncbi:hypothetical protein [Chthonobacter rhizosphaerae]|uniref:hypothetical protein n=1 Tax=Chthonobacter rhizosphaerae TaxID=2735553 RepID=UPI0015EFBC13|nr:hypothetical protein [Chthonobacter rhizosphaerae]
MIESALVFTLGALAAGLIALLVFPAFTRRAARLARKEAEARLPRSLNEIAAAKDAVRALFAARTARVEAESAMLRERLTEERMARAEESLQVSAARAEVQSLTTALRETEERFAALHAQLRDREEAVARLTVERRDLERRYSALLQRARAAETRVAEAEQVINTLRTQMPEMGWSDTDEAFAAPADDYVDVDYAELDERPRPADAQAAPALSPAAPERRDRGFDPVPLRPAQAAGPAEASGSVSADGPVTTYGSALRPDDAPRMPVSASAALATDTGVAGIEPARPTRLEATVDWSERIDELARRIRRFRTAAAPTGSPADEAADAGPATAGSPPAPAPSDVERPEAGPAAAVPASERQDA